MYRLYVLSLILLAVGCMPSAKQTELVFEENGVSKTGGSTSGGNSGGSTTSGSSSGGTSGGTTITNRAESLKAFKETVYPVVRNHTCVTCHNSQGRSQSPVFADNDAEKAFDALTSSGRVNLSSPEASRIYLKVRDNSHNCWSDCGINAAEILAAITSWAQQAPASSDDGIFTSALTIPAENTAVPAQTEYGTLLLQAEQPNYASEVIQGRFTVEQQSTALEGKYLVLSSPESNPQTNAARFLRFDGTNFDSCEEFSDVNLAPATRAMRFMQQKVHIPSGIVENGKTVQDGYRPFSAGLGFSIVRPDKRLEYARKLYSGSLTDLDSVLVFNGSPVATAKTVGTKLPDEFQGNQLSLDSNVNILPHFANPYSIYNRSTGAMITSGNYTRDDGTSESIYTLFKDGSYLPSVSVIHKGLVRNPHYKKDFIYKKYKDTVSSWFYTNGNKKAQSSFSYIFNSGTYNIEQASYFLPDVSISLRCPNEPVNPALAYNASTNPMKDCNANPNYLKFHVTNQSGEALTQGNALNCYTLNAGLTALVRAADSNCNGTNPKFFHYIDLFVHNFVMEPSIFGPVSMTASVSQSPTTYQEFETYSTDSSKNISIPNPSADQFDEIDTDVFFAGGSSNVSEQDNLTNFSNTLYRKLRSARCVDCHGNANNNNAPQFASNMPSTALSVLSSGGYINFTTPASSFRPNGMVHNCDAASTDPRYSCNTTDENALREALTNEIIKWKDANSASAIASGAKMYRSLTRDERLPGRAKYKFKVTQAGLYNVWSKVRRSVNPNTHIIYFRILDRSNNMMKYSVGSSGSVMANGCYKWALDTTNESWEWSTPGRSSELASIDQKGYLLLDNNKNPLNLANNRVYFNLPVGDYTLDIIGLSENLKIDAVGLNLVENMSASSRLAFQPDRIAIDEKNVSDYKRKILRYDLTSLLQLTQNKKAYFEIEVKKDFNGQNFIFRNPRFITEPRTFNLRFKGIKVYINDKHNFPDATYNSLEGVVGDNTVLTYAPLVALTELNLDQIKFKFDQISVSTESLTTFYPKGTPPAPIEDRRCADLDYFIKNVKPILRNAKLHLVNELNDYYGRFPGGARSNSDEPQVYNCISCHTANHPYFKMSTFSNNEEFCREALSRVDFQNFYQSLVIRGINGTGNHPKFVFIEKFITGPDSNFKNHDMAQDYVSGYQPVSIPADGLNLATLPVPGPMMVWNKTDLGIAGTNWNSLSAAEKTRMTYNGRFRKLTKKTINMDVVNYPWYLPETHARLIFDRDDPLRLDNILTALDVISPNPAIGRIEPNRDSPANSPAIFVIDNNDSNGNPAVANIRSAMIPLKAGTRVYRANAEPAIDRATIDYISTTPGINTRSELQSEHEILRDYYREKVIDWIRRENAARLAE